MGRQEWTSMDGMKESLVKAQKNGTCREIYSIGQSMGAAVASLFAYCAKQPENKQPENVRGFIVPPTELKLYAFGSPAFVWRRKENMDLGGIEGLRFYTKGLNGKTDLVPAVLQQFGFNNP